MRDSQSPEVAKAHIEQIRREKGLDNGKAQNQNAADLERALKIVSDELYHKSTHFLLELIQNADDNTYDIAGGIKPTLDITLYDDHIRVDCNEIGFSPKNVEAICRIGNSTKAGADNATRYVGEKGIGFKSVFKVADAVYIASQGYSFKFEKNGPLGMIAPIWTEFPIPARRGCTTFYLHFFPNCNRKDLLKEVLALDPRMLIFLRQLRQININVEVKDHPPLSRTLSRLPDKASPLGSTITLLQDFSVFKYLVFSHQAKRLPLEPKREGICESQLLLAFPIADNQPKLEPQQVYAFLPVRDYGLQFLLQGDFLLIASREDVDDSSEWNRTLRRRAIDALVETARTFNTGPLKYTWPRYLPGKAKVSGFFDSFKKALEKRFAIENLLENCDGKFVAPSALTYCPAEFCDQRSRPLTLTADTSRNYLSPNYDSEDYEVLSTFGVQKMTSKHFLGDLTTLISNHPDFFYSRAQEWHSNLAKALVPLTIDSQYTRSLLTLKLVPLRDGRWVSMQQGNIFFSGDRHGLTIPEGVDLMVVDPTAAEDPYRQRLFSLLGVNHFSVSLLCKMIVSTHNSPNFDPFSISEAALLSQVLFLYNACWKNEDKVRIWCVSERNGRLPAHKLYLDSEKPHSASKIFVTQRGKFQFVHRSYLSAVSQHAERWLNWLRDGLDIATHPRLVTYSSKDTFELASDFAWMLSNRPSTDFLLLLRDQWGQYEDFIENDEADGVHREPNLSRALIRNKLASTMVKCRDAILRPLDKTFLPADDLVAMANGCIPFLDVPDPQDKRWRPALRSLGVGLKNDLQFYLHALGKLKGRGPSLDQVSNFLEQIQARSGENIQQIKNCFRDDSLVYIPPSDHFGYALWVTPQACVWDGPKCLRTLHVLKGLYPQNQKLFCDILGVQDTKVGNLIQEARALKPSDDLQYITSLFTEIEKFLKDETSDESHSGLRTNKIFPVRNGSSHRNFDLLHRADSANEWFIADCSHFQRSFHGKIPLLAFDAGDVGRIKRVLRKAGVETRRLSALANGTAHTNGNATVLTNETRAFKSKISSILRLIPDTETNRVKIFRQLRAVELSKAPRVIQNWSVKCGGNVIHGEPEDGHVALSSDEDSLHIYFTQSSMDTRRSNSELVEKLSSFCGFDKGSEDGLDRKYLLLCIITEPDQAEIDSLLDKHRVPPLLSDSDLAAEDERHQKEQLKPRGVVPAAIQPTGGTGAGYIKPDATHTAIAGVAENICLENIRVFTVNDEFSSASNAKYFLLSKSPGGLPGAGNAYLVEPGMKLGANETLGMENIHVHALKIRMPEHEAERIAGLGEVFVSKILQTKILGQDYDPEEHWTSKYRTLAGHKPLPFHGPHSSKASFTIDDSNGVFTKWLTKLTESAESWQTKPPTYHLEVKATKRGLGDEFKLQHAEFLRARRYRTPDYGYPTDVSILVRVWNLETSDPQMTLFVDTWAWYMADRILFQALDGFRGHVLV